MCEFRLKYEVAISINFKRNCNIKILKCRFILSLQMVKSCLGIIHLISIPWSPNFKMMVIPMVIPKWLSKN